MTSQGSDPQKSFAFGFKAMKKYPELLPLVTIMGVAVAGVAGFSIYSLFAKIDVQLDKSDAARWETIDLNKPSKFITYNQKYGEDPAITALKQEVSDAYRK